ncbi:energy transducer TonB [Methylacidimicrobium sp. B4]|uniref:energy transducer TonB n=1 Tax=Methylacidimicrobium sp. B4 TaxID=2796139 RepID=UPI001A8EEEA7|nr:energy transducer TonB [Methylacidimicrobium sp. B4]QSR84658.1 TonB family protein [Methylacidimicrobium sp. B4]
MKTTKALEAQPRIAQPASWGIWPAIILAILFHVGLACLVLPGVPGSPVPAIAPLGPQFSSSSTSVELIEEAPLVPNAGAPLPEEQKLKEPEPFPIPVQPLPDKPLVAQHSHRPAAPHPARARQSRAPALGGGLVLPEPPYPLEARRQGWQGKVTLQVFVQEGRVAWVEVLSSSGHSVLDGSAKQWALHHWRFPGIAAGAFTEAVVFSLDGV